MLVIIYNMTIQTLWCTKILDNLKDCKRLKEYMNANII